MTLENLDNDNHSGPLEVHCACVIIMHKMTLHFNMNNKMADEAGLYSSGIRNIFLDIQDSLTIYLANSESNYLQALESNT